MIEFRTVTHVAGLKGIEVTTFLLNPTDVEYRMWWKGTHLQFHPVTGSPGTGSTFYMDEYIGARRVRMTAILIESVPGAASPGSSRSSSSYLPGCCSSSRMTLKV